MDTKTDREKKEVGSLDCTGKNKKSKKSKKSKKRKHSSSGSELETSPKIYKSKKHKKKCKKKHKHAKDKNRKLDLEKALSTEATNTESSEERDTIVGPEIPKEILEKAQTMAPMSKEEWEKKQKTITRVFDETTGRSRLIRGEGEIIEEIVSKERHRAINRQATQGDGDFFQSKVKKYI